MEASHTAQPLLRGQAPPAERASPLKKKPQKLHKNGKAWGFPLLFLILAACRLAEICQSSFCWTHLRLFLPLVKAAHWCPLFFFFF